ncbi:MAG: hypothetical protein O3C21_14640 [Verrucomicrobia bacterium]|nr:hypothetical protein [Verrucomicrobiota bacterium]
MRRPHYKMTRQRCRALASVIAQHGIYAYRNGAESIPARAFHFARKLDPDFSVEERPWYRTGARGVGYMNMERFLAAARGFRDRVYLAN